MKLSRRALLARMAGLVAVAEAGLLNQAFAAERFNWASTGGTWGETIKKAFIDTPGWPAKTGLEPVNTAQLETVSISKIIASKSNPPYDVSNNGPAEAVQLRDAGMALDYDLSLIPNWKDIPPQAKVGNYFGSFTIMSMGLAWNTKEAKKPTSFRDLWDRKYKGRIGVPAYGWYGQYWLHALNKTLGGNEDNISPAMRAVADLVKQNDPIMIENAGHGMNLLEKGEIVMAPYFSGRVVALQEKGVPVGFEYVDGTLAVGQGFVIVKGTQFAKQASMLVNNTLDPELQLIFAKFSKYPPSNARSKLPDDLKNVAIPAGGLDRAATLDYSKVAKNQAAYLERWNKEVLAT